MLFKTLIANKTFNYVFLIKLSFVLNLKYQINICLVETEVSIKPHEGFWALSFFLRAKNPLLKQTINV